ncbi:MAG: 4'-phosphopantetheinyl transferase family protein [Thiolinea sp.]
MVNTPDLDMFQASIKDFASSLSKKQEVHLHVIASQQVKHAALSDLLDEHEKLKKQSFRFNKDQVLYQAAHSFLRRTLSHYELVRPEDWRFNYDNYGKPSIGNPNHNNLTFNLSHAHSMIACVVGYQNTLGVDIERHRSLDNFEDMCRLVLCEHERKHLFSLAPQIQKAMFFRYWTLKEACVKALGQGLTIPLHSLRYKQASNNTWQYQLDVAPETRDRLYSFYYDLPQDNYSLAMTAEVSSADDLPDIRLFDWNDAVSSCHRFNVFPEKN